MSRVTRARSTLDLNFHLCEFSSSVANHPTKLLTSQPPKIFKMVKTKKSGDTLSSRLALVMKSGKGTQLVSIAQ